MPRRKSNLSIEERISQIDSDISVKEEEIKELKAQKKMLVEKKKQADLEEIYKMISESGKSLDEVKNMLAN